MSETKKIEIRRESIEDIKHCLERTTEMWEPYIDTWPLTLTDIVERWDSEVEEPKFTREQFDAELFRILGKSSIQSVDQTEVKKMVEALFYIATQLKIVAGEEPEQIEYMQRVIQNMFEMVLK